MKLIQQILLMTLRFPQTTLAALPKQLNFSKSQTLWTVAYKTSIDKPRQMTWSQFSIKMVGVYFHNSPHESRNQGKIFDKLTKTFRTQLSLRGAKLP